MEKKISDKVIVPVMLKYNISREEAEARVHLLYESGILPNNDYNDPGTQQMVDDFLATDSQESAGKVLLEKTIIQCWENKEFVRAYERLTKRNLSQAIADAESGVREDIGEKEFKKFAKFVKDSVFDRLP